ncbi:hypothetical protein FNV43_RR03605 [Rhamnella rubrinervis]|uniref:Uncharacterized protein n=1 Tax=Rhamnella rubrinervis TaxID=2594499 RepID=A0A8K0HJG0_9ROSA|nr:hypothetical protein FNV43_RR03605 [Rhamnella rubrinervis]
MYMIMIIAFSSTNISSIQRIQKIVADRWEFANEYFKRGAKHLLSEIHRRKTTSNHQHHHYHQASQYPQPPASADDHHHHHHHHESFGWIQQSPPLMPSPKPASSTDILTALSEDNQRLRRKNLMLLSELTHMKNLYNDIIYFIQNHVKPTLPYNVFDQNNTTTASTGGAINIPKLLELGSSSFHLVSASVNTSTTTSTKTCGPQVIIEEANSNTSASNCVKLFGVSLSGKRDCTQKPWIMINKLNEIGN